MDGLDPCLEQFEETGASKHTVISGHRSITKRATGRRRQRLARCVAMPAALHAQVAPQLETGIKQDQQMLAERLHLGHRPAKQQSLGTWAGQSRPCGGHRPTDEVRAQPGCRPMEGVALRHPCLPSVMSMRPGLPGSASGRATGFRPAVTRTRPVADPLSLLGVLLAF